MTPERYNRITEVLRKRQPDLTVITDEVHKQRNLAAIIRNCDAVGINEIHCVMPDTGYQIYSGTSASAQKWVDVRHYENAEQPVKLLKDQGYQIIAANLTEHAVDYRQVDYTRPTALILGAEVKGVSETSLGLADDNVILPMYGMVESYNVSVACALILAEAQRQRTEAGLYSERRLPQKIYDEKFFRWAHPKLADYCDERGISYPPVRDDGEVENLSDWYQTVRQEYE